LTEFFSKRLILIEVKERIVIIFEEVFAVSGLVFNQKLNIIAIDFDCMLRNFQAMRFDWRWRFRLI
jgi:hypothetical protein